MIITIYLFNTSRGVAQELTNFSMMSIQYIFVNFSTFHAILSAKISITCHNSLPQLVVFQKLELLGGNEEHFQAFTKTHEKFDIGNFVQILG